MEITFFLSNPLPFIKNQTYQTYPTCWTCESGIPVDGIWLEGHGEAGGDLAAGEVVWHGVLNVVYVGNPVVAAHV